jgi:hypothetical protein
VAVSINPDYYATKHRSLAALGSNWTVLEDFDQVPDRPTAGGYSPEVLAELRKTKVEVAKSVYAPVERRPVPGAPAEPQPESLRRRWSRRIRG